MLLLAIATVFTWRTIESLSARRDLRIELAEISHARYDLLNTDHWIKKIVPILDARIDALDWKASSQVGPAAYCRKGSLPPAGRRERKNER